MYSFDLRPVAVFLLLVGCLFGACSYKACEYVAEKVEVTVEVRD